MEQLQKVKYLVIHHSGNSDTLEKIRNLHVNINGWEDIGYHWLIDREGKVLKGRDEGFMGAHVLGYNKNSIGICMIGNFDIEKPSKNQINSLILVLKELMQKYDINAKGIIGHREFPDITKACPGKFISLNYIREELKTSSS